MIEIRNIPSNHRKYVVARNVDNEYWYFGSFDNEEIAHVTALTVGGEVFVRGEE